MKSFSYASEQPAVSQSALQTPDSLLRFHRFPYRPRFPYRVLRLSRGSSIHIMRTHVNALRVKAG